MVNPVTSQPAAISRPEDEPKNETPQASESQSTNNAVQATNAAGGPQPTPGGTNVAIHPGAPGAGGGAINNPAGDSGFKDNGSATNISA
jgi:hypothetical protein